MKYIKITNQTDIVNRLKLEKIGFSTKRDDDSTIGQFGSGIKFAPIAAVRKGMRFVFSGFDEKGAYNLEYVAKDDDGINSIFYKYDDYEKPSSFTAEAGVMSWQDDFQIYREIIANAIDENKITGNAWSADIVEIDEIKPVPGEFSVYITATDGLIEIHNNFDKYFTVNRYPVYEYGDVKFYKPIDNLFRVYCKGVLVYTGNEIKKTGYELSGFFDYDLGHEIELNEERSVRYPSYIANIILRYIGSINDYATAREVVNLFLEAQDNGFDKYYETSSIAEYVYETDYAYGNTIEQVFRHEYPNTVILPASESSANVLISIRSKGYTPLVIEHMGFYKFFKRVGAPTFEEIFGNHFAHATTMKCDDYPVLQQAIAIVNSVIPETSSIKDVIGVYYDDSDRNTMALTTNAKISFDDEPKTRILFNSYFAESLGIKDMIATIVHEWDHYRSGYSDGNSEGRAFRNLADQTIGELIYQLWKYKRIKTSEA